MAKAIRHQPRHGRTGRQPSTGSAANKGASNRVTNNPNTVPSKGYRGQ